MKQNKNKQTISKNIIFIFIMLFSLFNVADYMPEDIDLKDFIGILK
jgi:hypothetical protein